MSAGENVRVAVRVRPFSDREKKRQPELIVAMSGNTTTLINPKNPKSDVRKFAFDYSYWSHDGYKKQDDGYLSPTNKKYVDQVHVFQDLGKGMLNNAWEGYNSTLFAYGQTGSGKSYSIVGTVNNAGLIPRVCEELFKKIDAAKNSDVTYEVMFSMLEIYNEEVRDLLAKKKTPQRGLKVKEGSQSGFYVEGLTNVPVGSYKDIRLRMTEGERQRTIAATKMNETSSRAHTIVAITFAQNEKKHKMTKSATINLVDLAGSERAKQSEATGDRFEEAKNINKSLLTLGNVIKGLCDKIKNKNASIHIPYRDSILTKLLKNALGGNSKTIMIAAISPDAENYEQTLSTLRYADKAKSIKNVARVNEQATNKLIQQLIAEKKRLLKELESVKQGSGGMSEAEIERIKEEKQREIESYKEQLDDMEQFWQKRLEESRREMDELLERERKQEEEEKKMPHFSNLNEDPSLTGKLVYLCRPGTLLIGNGKDNTTPDILISGLRLAKKHAIVRNEGKEVILEPLNGLILHNGKEIKKAVQLKHQDRVRFGSNSLFVFINPREAEALKKKGHQAIDVTYEYALDEIARHSGFDICPENTILRDEVLHMMQLVNNVNAMAEDMEKPVEFSPILVSAEARGQNSGITEVYVKVLDHDNHHEYLWDKNKFLNRQVHMQEAYQIFDQTGKPPEVEKEKDPFWEPPDTEMIVGVTTVPLSYLAHMLDFQEEPLSIVDYQAKQSGFLKVDLLPCDSSGSEDVDLCVDDPMDLVGKSVTFKIKVIQAFNLPEQFEKTWCQYRFYQDTAYIKTSLATGKNPKYDHEKLFHFKNNEVDHKFVSYLSEGSLAVEVWGQQGGDMAMASSTKHKRQEERQKLISEVDRLQEKLDMIRSVVNRMPGNVYVKKLKEILGED